MKRLLMFLYLLMVMSEARPKRGWKLFTRRRQPDTFLTFAESGVMSLLKATHAEPKTSPTTKPTGEMSETTSSGTPDPKHKAVVEVIPLTMVEQEAECAISLQMPNRTTPQGIRAYGNRRYDTPIGRTLTREFLVRDPGHTPPAALRHLPIMDSVRAMYVHRDVGPHPTSPAPSNAETRKGRATPKRPRRPRV